MNDRFKFRDERGLRASINRDQVKATLYVEGSLCLETGAAGWGCVYVGRQGHTWASGALQSEYGNAVTLMELAAAQEAVRHALTSADPIPWVQSGEDYPFALAMRSTAAMAVLRWVFPDSPFIGACEVLPPKRLSRDTQEFPPLYDLSEDVEKAKVDLHLRQVAFNSHTAYAQQLARHEMEQLRPKRRAAR